MSKQKQTSFLNDWADVSTETGIVREAKSGREG